MAKVDSIEMTIDGKLYKYNINVGKTGIFKCELHANVANILGLSEYRITASTLREVQDPIFKAYHAYMESNKIESTHIWIRYASSGAYSNDSSGVRLFSYGSKFGIDRFSNTPDSIQFDFGVFIQVEHSTGTKSRYNAQLGQGCTMHKESHLKDPETWYKNDLTYSIDGVIIPYSKEAYQTLKKAREGIRGISEILFNFINQDVDKIEASLLGGNLLTSPNQTVES